MQIDLQALRQMNDDDLEQALLAFVFAKLKAMPDDAVEAISSLPEGFRPYYVSWLVEAEVLNGGFHQFFWNPSSDFADDAADAFRAIGDQATAEIMSQALEAALAELPETARFMKIGTLEAFSQSAKRSKLGAFDEAFYERAPALPGLRAQFFRANSNLFVAERP
jgi:hypothetical protein